MMLVRKYLPIFILFFYSAYGQIKKEKLCQGDSSGDYFALHLGSKKVFWNDTFFYENRLGIKKIKEKKYIKFQQRYANNESDTIYLREEDGVVYEYEDSSKIEFVRFDKSFGLNHTWKVEAGSKSREYTIKSFNAELSTPICEYKKLLLIEAKFKKNTYEYYYSQGIGFVGSKRDGKLNSYTSLVFEKNPFQNENSREGGYYGFFAKKVKQNSSALKILPYINFLEGGYGTWIGFEKGFKNHSLGLKFLYDKATPHRDEKIDYTYDIDKILIAEYRYYFDFNFLDNSMVRPFTSLSYKIGSRIIDNDREYKHDFYHQEIKTNYIGPAFGLAYYSWDGFGVEAQFSYLFGRKNITTESVVPNLPNTYESFKTDYLRFELLIVYAFDF